MNELSLDLCVELDELSTIAAESIGWIPLGEGTYLHIGNSDEDEVVITITGVPDVAMTGMNVLLVC